jgi:hypothetical protein
MGISIRNSVADFDPTCDRNLDCKAANGIDTKRFAAVVVASYENSLVPCLILIRGDLLIFTMSLGGGSHSRRIRWNFPKQRRYLPKMSEPMFSLSLSSLSPVCLLNGKRVCVDIRETKLRSRSSREFLFFRKELGLMARQVDFGVQISKIMLSSWEDDVSCVMRCSKEF